MCILFDRVILKQLKLKLSITKIYTTEGVKFIPKVEDLYLGYANLVPVIFEWVHMFLYKLAHASMDAHACLG